MLFHVSCMRDRRSGPSHNNYSNDNKLNRQKLTWQCSGPILLGLVEQSKEAQFLKLWNYCHFWYYYCPYSCYNYCYHSSLQSAELVEKLPSQAVHQVLWICIAASHFACSLTAASEPASNISQDILSAGIVFFSVIYQVLTYHVSIHNVLDHPDLQHYDNSFVMYGFRKRQHGIDGELHCIEYDLVPMCCCRWWSFVPRIRQNMHTKNKYCSFIWIVAVVDSQCQCPSCTTWLFVSQLQTASLAQRITIERNLKYRLVFHDSNMQPWWERDGIWQRQRLFTARWASVAWIRIRISFWNQNISDVSTRMQSMMQAKTW